MSSREALEERPKDMPEFFHTDEVHLRSIRASGNGMLLRGPTWSKKLTGGDSTCPHCASEIGTPQVKVQANCEFADGIGGRLFAKLDFKTIQVRFRISEEDLLDELDRRNPGNVIGFIDLKRNDAAICFV